MLASVLADALAMETPRTGFGGRSAGREQAAPAHPARAVPPGAIPPPAPGGARIRIK